MSSLASTIFDLTLKCTYYIKYRWRTQVPWIFLWGGGGLNKLNYSLISLQKVKSRIAIVILDYGILFITRPGLLPKHFLFNH